MTRNVKYAVNYERNGKSRTIYLNNGNEAFQLMIILADSFAIGKRISITSELDGQVLASVENGKLDYVATDLIATQEEN